MTVKLLSITQNIIIMYKELKDLTEYILEVNAYVYNIFNIFGKIFIYPLFLILHIMAFIFISLVVIPLKFLFMLCIKK